MRLIGGAFTGLPTTWDLSTPILAGAFVATLLFAHAFVRLRRRGRTDLAGWDRPILFAAGIVLATTPLISPLDTAGDRFLISAHMLEHVLIGDASPALLLLAVRGPLVFFLLPDYALRPLARVDGLRAALGFLLRPGVSFALWMLTIGAWHVPAAYDYALRQPAVHDLEHLSFIVAGLLVWSQLIDPARRGALSVPGRLVLAGALFGLGQVLTGVLLLSPALYPAYVAQPDRLLGLSPLKDQQLAGLVMMGEQMLTLGACAIFLMRQLSRQANAKRHRSAATASC
ncbi:MAG TPA: cytochrome c oxidase assembly protein [Gaiellaceae bacterium]|nr:cytochrome c oxidase assembly protein [Gaiellaceae bacterium]